MYNITAQEQIYQVNTNRAYTCASYSYRIAPSNYEVLYQPTPIHLASLLKSHEPATNQRDSLTILTNPDEELKSVDRQLKQLEVQGSRSDVDDDDEEERQPLSGMTNNTDHSNGPVSTAIKEVEYMLNQNHEPVQSPEPIIAHERQITSSSQPITDDFSTGIYNALGMDSQQELNKNESQVELAPLSAETPVLPSFDQQQTQESSKYKPMPNPNYNNNNHTPSVGIRTSSLNIKKEDLPAPIKSEDDDEDEEEHEYHQRMPRLPPKDEKWMISSIRRPQQLPVRTLNAKIFDSTSSARSSVISPNQSMDYVETTKEEEEPPRQPKAHRPVVPLTIDIPNAIPKQKQQENTNATNYAQNAAQQVIEEGRRLSQMSPIPQKLELQPQPMDMMRYSQQVNTNPMEEGGIRPAPWQEDFNTDDQMVPNNPHMSGYYGNGYHHPPGGNYTPGPPGPRGSSLTPGIQQQQEQEKKRFGGKKTSEPKSTTSKEPKSGRFSLGFFNKKDKKKEKEKEPPILESSNFNINRPLSQQQIIYQPKQSSLQEFSDRKSNHSGSQHNIPYQQQPPPPPPQQQPLVNDYSRFIGFAKAQWPFEATVSSPPLFFFP